MVQSVTISYNLVHSATIWTAVYILLVQFLYPLGTLAVQSVHSDSVWYNVVNLDTF